MKRDHVIAFTVIGVSLVAMGLWDAPESKTSETDSTAPLSQYADSICRQTFEIVKRNQLDAWSGAGVAATYAGCDPMSGVASTGTKDIVVNYKLSMSQASNDARLAASVAWDLPSQKVLSARWESCERSVRC